MKILLNSIPRKYRMSNLCLLPDKATNRMFSNQQITFSELQTTEGLYLPVQAV